MLEECMCPDPTPSGGGEPGRRKANCKVVTVWKQRLRKRVDLKTPFQHNMAEELHQELMSQG